ncbi:OmpA family protein [Chryseobacterium indologenes]|uniref:OmpA family protein n=1 Tax=Chryseobacterium indologenes TaxID=253 RepID=UPI00102451A1|nr:OmpA family protein [Chryseobacterium indologenes]VFA44101.1 Photosystem I P700 chlorophyll a apoprotein A2 [Chryseobacterium indologenes]
MAHLEVKPKNGTPWWVWLILALIALAILLFSLRRCNGDTKENKAVTDTLTTSTANQKDAVAMTEPDWSSVNFNSPASADPDIADKDIVVRNGADYTIFTLGENILFATDDNKIQGSSEAKLKRIVEVLNKRYKGSYIGVYGNTDSTGTANHNKKLGADRAAAVQEWLINSGEIEKDRLSIHSLGEKEPVATNSNEPGRQQNRNVEIVAFKQK